MTALETMAPETASISSEREYRDRADRGQAPDWASTPVERLERPVEANGYRGRLSGSESDPRRYQRGMIRLEPVDHVGPELLGRVQEMIRVLLADHVNPFVRDLASES